MFLPAFTQDRSDVLILKGRPKSAPFCSRTKGKAEMKNMSGFEQGDEEIFASDISDESLEIAAGSGADQAGIYTLGSCTGYYSCPPQLT